MACFHDVMEGFSHADVLDLQTGIALVAILHEQNNRNGVELQQLGHVVFIDRFFPDDWGIGRHHRHFKYKIIE